MEFPPILVINLPDRKDRWTEIQASFTDWPALERIDAVKDSPGWRGCNKSHVKALELAQSRGYPWVLVLEDDCDPVEGALQRFKDLLPSLWAKRSQWDVFLGGCTSVKDVSLIQSSPALLSVKGHTTHFCLYTQNSYTKLIHGIKNTDTVIDSFFRESPTIRCFCTAPHLATQRPSKSDLQDQHTDYAQVFKTSNDDLLKATSVALEGFVNETRTFRTKVVLADLLLVGLLGALHFLLHR